MFLILFAIDFYCETQTFSLSVTCETHKEVCVMGSAYGELPLLGGYLSHCAPKVGFFWGACCDSISYHGFCLLPFFSNTWM